MAVDVGARSQKLTVVMFRGAGVPLDLRVIRKLRIKLVTIPWELEVPTLSLACLAAVTPADRVDLAIVDVLRERLVEDEPVDAVGITASTPRIKAAYRLADSYRARGVKVILGGHHATALPREALEHADAVVTGEGESAWARIVDGLLTSPATVGGIYKGGTPNLADLPAPDTRRLRLERYGGFYYPLRMSPAFRTYPIARVLEQVRARPRWVKAAYFVDDNLAGDPDFARELFRALAREPDRLPFGMQVRSELADDGELLRLARQAGCALISSGYESVNQRTLDGVRKRASAADYRRRIAAIHAEGMIASGNFMFGFDDDGPEIFDDTLAFLDETRMLHASFTVEIPFPGTSAWRRYRDEGRLLSHDYDHYVGKDHVLVHPRRMSPDQLRRGIRRLALAFYGPRRRLRLAVTAAYNRRLLAELGTARIPALMALNAFQMWQWHNRMSRPGAWLYRALVPAARLRYPSEWTRRSNFS
jgi:radical SAM superfamily enzyme YgiQ (UPF0313 family)